MATAAPTPGPLALAHTLACPSALLFLESSHDRLHPGSCAGFINPQCSGGGGLLLANLKPLTPRATTLNKRTVPSSPMLVQHPFYSLRTQTAKVSDPQPVTVISNPLLGGYERSLRLISPIPRSHCKIYVGPLTVSETWRSATGEPRLI